ncbi:MAG: hypothetical protein [Caudoviricetes sp.]|nr:MAG: hypothetical protein [Caudoviricetes sp.]
MRFDSMKYYWNSANSQIYAFDREGSEDQFIFDGLELMTNEEVDQYYFKLNNPDPSVPPSSEIEVKWVAQEMEVIKEQLLRLEDEDPSALPGTERQWRDYRIALRAWKPGAEGFPYQNKRPKRPQ